MTNKHKAGDRLYTVAPYDGDDEGPSPEAGLFCTVDEPIGQGVRVVFDDWNGGWGDGGHTWFYPPKEAERCLAALPRVGDRLKVVKESARYSAYASPPVGSVGSVVVEDRGVLTVAFDGWSGGWRHVTDEGEAFPSCWVYITADLDELELVPNDPREDGFNYGRPLPMSDDDANAAQLAQELLDKVASSLKPMKDAHWALEMAYREVRHAVTREERNAAWSKVGEATIALIVAGA